jgi:hypothetical protein
MTGTRLIIVPQCIQDFIKERTDRVSTLRRPRIVSNLDRIKIWGIPISIGSGGGCLLSGLF